MKHAGNCGFALYGPPAICTCLPVPAPLGDGISDERLADLKQFPMKSNRDDVLAMLAEIEQSRRLSSGRDRNATIEALREALELAIDRLDAVNGYRYAAIVQHDDVIEFGRAALKTPNGDKPPSPAGEQT